jgi:HEPN domain-containing protein
MRYDPKRVADTRAWLMRAALDLRAAEFEQTADPPISGDIAFHSQQLVEKTLKAFLTWHDQPFRKTHNLVELGEPCAAIVPSLEPLLRRAAVLTEYAWRFRYPGEPEEPPAEEADEALTLAREVYDAVLARLPRDVRP